MTDSIAEPIEAETTDPYGHLMWAIGNGDNFHCFDVAVAEDGQIVLHSVVNCETNHSIEDAARETMRPEHAEVRARQLLDAAWDWTVDPEPLDMRGSMRDSKRADRAFMNAVRAAVHRSQESMIQYQPDGVQRCHACHRSIGGCRPSQRIEGWYYHANHVPTPHEPHWDFVDEDSCLHCNCGKGVVPPADVYVPWHDSGRLGSSWRPLN